MTHAFIYICCICIEKQRKKKQKRKNRPLCRVLKPIHSAKWPSTGQYDSTLPSAKTLALGKVSNICRVPGSSTWQSGHVPRLSAKSLPNARNPTLGKDPFAVGSFAEWRLPSVTLDNEFTECKLAFAECNRHSAKPVNPVVYTYFSKNITHPFH